MSKETVVIGCGGIGCRIAPELVGLASDDTSVTLVDRDIVEEHNLDRQFFAEEDVSRPKAGVLARSLRNHPRVRSNKVNIRAIEQYLGHPDLKDELPAPCVVFVCVDNHPARVKSLELVDADLSGQSLAVFAANETDSAEAYVYFSAWKDSVLDPRIYYPELLTTLTDNPLSPSCTSAEELERFPQLGIANQRAAALATWLFFAWSTIATKYKDIDHEGYQRLPYRVTSTAAHMIPHRIKDALHPE